MRAAHPLLPSIAIISIRVKSAISSPDADSSTSVGGAEESTRPQPVPTRQLYKLGRTPIKLEKNFLHTQNYSDHKFLREGFQHGFKLQYFGPRSPRFSKNLTSLDKQYPVESKRFTKKSHWGGLRVLS